MRFHRLFIILTASLPCFAADPPALNTALHRLYSFDFPGAHQMLAQLSAASPSDPLPRAFEASALLFSELDRLGILESEFLTDDEKIADKKKKLEPDPAVRTAFLKAVNDADRLGQAALKANPSDRNAL